MNGEWDSAPSSILTSLEMEGADVSKLVEAMDLAAAHRAEREANRDPSSAPADNEQAQTPAPPSCPAADPDSCEKYFRNTYNSCLQRILAEFYKSERAAKIEQARALPPDDPRYAGLVAEIGEISKQLLNLPKKYKVVI